MVWMAYLSTKAKRRAFSALKLIGILLFLWILTRIDRGEVITIIGTIHPLLLLAVIPGPFAVYTVRTLRWHILIQCAGHNTTLKQSWRVYNIGAFLAIITPARVGELGRAVYLQREGMHVGTALAIVVMNRIVDAVIIALAGVGALALLFGVQAALIAAGGGVIISALCFVLWKISHPIRKQEWLSVLPAFLKPYPLLLTVLCSVSGWLIYFGWVILLSRGMGIDLPISILVSTLTLMSILAMIPIAPSGLGTREAALLFFMMPYGVSSEQAVSLGLLIFANIIVSGTLGAWYWLRGCHMLPMPQTP